MVRRAWFRDLVMLAASVGAVASTTPGQSKVGTSVGQFLGIPVGARAWAMGGAHVAFGDDASSIYWNPGAFVQSRRSQVSFQNTEWFAGTSFRWMGAVLNFDGSNAIGISVTQLDYGESDVTTVQSPDGTGERWGAQDIALSFSYSRLLTDRFSIGGSAKYIGQSLWNESASTFAIDVGLLFVTGFNDMRIGMSISNFGGDMTMTGLDLLQPVDLGEGNPGTNKNVPANLKTDSWPLPLFFRVGVAMDVIKDDMVRLTVAADALRPSDNVEAVNVGAELGWADMLFLRVGQRGIGEQDSQQGLAMGGGVRYDLPGVATLEMHYTYLNFGLLGNLNTLALALSF